MSDKHTATPWVIDPDDPLTVQTYSKGARTCLNNPMPSHVADAFESRYIDPDEAIANARRIVAAVNATKDFTTEGLEEIATKGLTLQLALRATWMMDSEKLETFEGMKKFLERAGALIKAEDESYPLSRGD